MKTINIEPNRLGASGKHCFLITKGDLVDYMCRKYGRPVALKVFDLHDVKTQEDILKVKWGDDPVDGGVRKNTGIYESAQIHNILSWHGLSNRVYGIETLYFGEKYYPMHVIELVEGDFYHSNDAVEIKKITSVIDEVGKWYGFEAIVHKVSVHDIIDGKMVDIQPYAFNKDYNETAKEIYFHNKYGKVYYQDVPELGLRGSPRKSMDRIKYLGLDKIDFNGKSVADVGCAGGFFARYAEEHGAKYILGLDHPDQIESARNMANALGYWRGEYQAVNLEKDTWDISDCEIVFFLSLNFHIGIPQQILDAKMVILEDNGKESRALSELGKPWTDNFSRIEFIGRALDHGDKAIYHLYK